MNTDFLNAIKRGKRIFGNPELRLTDEIKEVEKQINKYKEGFGKGDFFIPDKELDKKFKELKNQRTLNKKYGEYILKLVNKVTEEPFLNAIVFCDVEIDERRFQFVIQTRYATYLINFNTAKSASPVYVMDDLLYNSEGATLLELSEIGENDYDFKVLDVTYTQKPLLILKNDNYYDASSTLLNINELKAFIENDKRDELGEKRYEILDFLFQRYYKKEETTFVKNMKKMLE